MKSRIAVLTVRRLALAAAVVSGVAALPAAAAEAAAPPQPQPICLTTARGRICTYDIGPLVNQILADPAGYVCGQPEFTCGRV